MKGLIMKKFSKNNFIFLAVATALLVVAGCRNNPYPDSGILVQNKPDRKPAFGMEVEDILNFQEGVQGKFPLKGYVPSSLPQITFDGLPKDAVYDSVAGEIRWTPDYNAANDPKDPTVVEKVYPLVITLK